MVELKEKKQETKVCPQCGELVFSDMDTCFGCMYSFNNSRPKTDLPDLSREEKIMSLESFMPAEMLEKMSISELDEVIHDVGAYYRREEAAMKLFDDLEEPDDVHDYLQQFDDVRMMSVAELTDDEIEEFYSDLLHEDDILVSQDNPVVDSLDEDKTVVEDSLSTDKEKHTDISDAAFKPMTAWSLRVLTDAAAFTVPIVDGGLTIGRGISNDIVIKHELVSRHHLLITSHGTDCFVEDLESTNPAMCDDIPIRSKRKVSSGSRINLHGATLEIVHGMA